jgi:formylglycine-generating enzyme required for sulfatase activity
MTRRAIIHGGAPPDGSSWVQSPTSFARVYRGGSRDTRPENVGSAFRAAADPGLCGTDVGFRVAR